VLSVAKVLLHSKGKNCADGWSPCHKDIFETLHTVNHSARYGSMVGLMFGNHFPQRNNLFYSLFWKWLGLIRHRSTAHYSGGCIWPAQCGWSPLTLTAIVSGKEHGSCKTQESPSLCEVFFW